MRKFILCGVLSAAILLAGCGKDTNSAYAPFSSSEYRSLESQTVIDELTNAGFTNVTIENITSWLGTVGTVSSVKIDGNGFFNKGNKYAPDVPVTVECYVAPEPTPTPAPTASPVQQLAQQVDVSEEYAQSLIDAFAQIGVTDLSSARNIAGFVVVSYDGYDLYSDAIPSDADTAADTVQNIYYIDISFFTDGQAVATVNDVFVTADQANWLIVCVDDDVKQYLKSPSTAKFPGKVLEKDAYTVTKDAQYYYVEAYVDSENSFGATLRTHFIATYQWDGDTSILPTCVDVTFDE